jgi:hypothetical protein
MKLILFTIHLVDFLRNLNIKVNQGFTSDRRILFEINYKILIFEKFYLNFFITVITELNRITNDLFKKVK